jgi:ABC-type phosphate transport system permease subunit
MLKLFAMWFSLIILLIGSLGAIPVVIFCSVFRDTLQKELSLMDVIIACMVGLPSIVFLVYLAVSAWLLVWRYSATRAEVMQIASSGALTAFDRWLIRKLGPQQ